MSDGPFKLGKDGHIVGPVPLPSIPGMPGVVAVTVDQLNRLYNLGREAARMEDAALRRRQKERIVSVIADLELDLEPPPNFEELRKKPP